MSCEREFCIHLAPSRVNIDAIVPCRGQIFLLLFSRKGSISLPQQDSPPFRIVEQNLTSALILENDVDWDIRLKQQLRSFALGAHLLLQPLTGTTSTFLDPTYPAPRSPDDKPTNFDVADFTAARTVTPPTTSPYGDVHRWDVLWLGHCGTRFPKASDANAPLGRAVIADDASVPEQQHLDVEDGGVGLADQIPRAHARRASGAREHVYAGVRGVAAGGAAPVVRAGDQECDGDGGYDVSERV